MGKEKSSLKIFEVGPLHYNQLSWFISFFPFLGSQNPSPRNYLWRFQSHQGFAGGGLGSSTGLQASPGLSCVRLLSERSVTWKPVWIDLGASKSSQKRLPRNIIWLITVLYMVRDITAMYPGMRRDRVFFQVFLPCSCAKCVRLRIKLTDVYPNCPPTFACVALSGVGWGVELSPHLWHRGRPCNGRTLRDLAYKERFSRASTSDRPRVLGSWASWHQNGMKKCIKLHETWWNLYQILSNIIKYYQILSNSSNYFLHNKDKKCSHARVDNMAASEQKKLYGYQ